MLSMVKDRIQRSLVLLITIIMVATLVACELFEQENQDQDKVYGCRDTAATNFNPEVTKDDGSCDYCEEGSSFLLISTDGGDSWKFNCAKNMDIGSAFQISVIDSSNIWIACRQHDENENYYESIIYSSDMGRTWDVKYEVPNLVYQDGGAGLNEILFVDENNGLIVVDEPNDGPVFYSTNDGGDNWSQVQTPTTEGSLRNNRRVEIVDMNTVFFLNTNTAPRVFYGTNELGSPWDTTHFKNAFLLEFFDENVGMIADHRNVYRTGDGGSTWESNPLPFVSDDAIFWGYGIEFSNTSPENVWLLDLHFIHFSSDTGSSWGSYPYNDDWANDMHIYNNKAWILGSHTLRYSADATSGVWTDIDISNQVYPIHRWPEAVGGFKDEIIVMTGSF